MSETASPTLLPEGLRDVLPLDAEMEARLVEQLAASFHANGYDRVSPPLVEFENTLLAGMGAATADRIFRMVDPVSQRTLGLRADVTPQIARIASTRLRDETRPLRLMYAGQVMRVKGRQLRPERQFTQVGFELVGPESVAADAEAILVATEGVEALGITNLSIDLALPTLVPEILNGHTIAESDLVALRTALDHKDTTEIRALAGQAAETLTTLIEATGPVKKARAALNGLSVSNHAAKQIEDVFAVAEHLNNQAPGLSITVDLVENRGLQYHTGVTFFLFAKGSAREIGRGGRYHINLGENETEPATGATLFIDSLMSIIPPSQEGPCVLVPMNTDRDVIKALHREGHRTRIALNETKDFAAEARLQGCSHALIEGAVQNVSGKGRES